MFEFFKKKRVVKDLQLNMPFLELKKRAKIVVIDDEEDSFPTKLLKEDGYTIDWWEKVNASSLQRLEKGDFDIIILDIMGVAGEDISRDDGIGVLRRVKSVNTNQIVVAFSGQSYDLGKTEFWKLADDALSKPVTYIQCKEVLDALIKNKINMSSYWDSVKNILITSGVPMKRIEKLEGELVLSLDDKKYLDEQYIRKEFLSGVQNAAAVVTLVQAISRLWL